ncbi:alpha/beta fold hydrolase [Actinotalea sp. Marseille-Q4924]|uniref:alpha/beta fold hydrolase n=1 Tax=Actinotalea sp. Marseille-Q4924 TaxID=2866571 RepID=UPI001CE446F2|nr:alpha/beta fold hydrolase [Actinotalea sp. Marseille-Q4924]
MRTPHERLINDVQRPEAYDEVVLDGSAAPIVLSVWRGDPGAPAVLFLPGTMTHPLFYEEFLDGLNRRGLTVVGLHAAGHGKSPRTRHPLTFATVVGNALDALAWVRSTFPDAPPVLLGTSQGGVLAIAVAARTDLAAGVVAHNVLDASLPETLATTRLPRALAPAYSALRAALRGVAQVAPRLPVPFGMYLEMARVTRDAATAEQFWTDPLGRRSYPLRFLAEMLEEDVTQPVTCPVVVVATSGDPLFPLAYTRAVFARIEAPSKQLVVVASPEHLLFVHDPEASVELLVPRVRSFAERWQAEHTVDAQRA